MHLQLHKTRYNRKFLNEMIADAASLNTRFGFVRESLLPQTQLCRVLLINSIIHSHALCDGGNGGKADAKY